MWGFVHSLFKQHHFTSKPFWTPYFPSQVNYGLYRITYTIQVLIYDKTKQSIALASQV